jgi:uncharacterized protein YmfQ (DUF2313 family)
MNNERDQPKTALEMLNNLEKFLGLPLTKSEKQAAEETRQLVKRAVDNANEKIKKDSVSE